MAKKVSTIIDAARALNEVCDGAEARDAQGFNGVDAPFAKSILGQAFLTDKQLNALHQLLRKYGGQLAKLGFIYSELVVPKAGYIHIGEHEKSHVKIVTVTENPTPKKQEPKKEEPQQWTPRLPWTMTTEELLKHFPEGMTPRPKQIDALTKINEAFRSGKRVVALEMPTGGGKSPICITVARAMRAANGRTHFLTVQKALQDQYTRDFPAPEVEVLKGRSNYQCSHENGGGMSCADAPCSAVKKGILPECIVGGDDSDQRRAATRLQLKPEEQLCPYWRQLQLCNDNPITLFNFSSFLFQQRVKRFGKRDLMIIDEAHKIEGQMMSFVTLELTEFALSIIGVEIDRDITTREQLMEWLRENKVLSTIHERLEKKGDNADEESFEGELSKVENEALKELEMKLEIFLGAAEESEWIYETVEYNDRRGDRTKKIVARPIFGKTFAQGLLFSKADRALVMSATILDVKLWSKNLGFEPGEVALVQTACDFPAENRPIHLEYAGSMGFKWYSREQNPKDPTEPKFMKKVAQIIERHAGQRGLIHCQSNALARSIFQGVESDRLLFQDHFDNKDELFAAHRAKPDSVIVSPGIKEGFDFRDDLARFQIIAKVPWASMTDKVVKERMNREPQWYAWLTALDLVQSYGRIVRSKDDWGYSYIVDSGFESFCSRNGGMLPVWFREAFRKGAPREVRK
jgi:ATP-dependent DNA helicase DinG